jgi:hypothetical protein
MAFQRLRLVSGVGDAHARNPRGVGLQRPSDPILPVPARSNSRPARCRCGNPYAGVHTEMIRARPIPLLSAVPGNAKGGSYRKKTMDAAQSEALIHP